MKKQFWNLIFFIPDDFIRQVITESHLMQSFEEVQSTA